MSIVLSFLLSTIRIFDLYLASNQYYAKVNFGFGPIYIPRMESIDEVQLNEKNIILSFF